MTELIKTFNPANAAALTPEQIQQLQNLTIEEIKVLADAYPNASYPAAYLLIVDKTQPVEKQLPTLSSFPNLYNLITRNNLKQFAPFNFKGNYRPVKSAVRPLKTARRSEVLDLGETELMNLPGFKADKEVIPPEVIQVKKIRKQRKPNSEKTNPA